MSLGALTLATCPIEHFSRRTAIASNGVSSVRGSNGFRQVASHHVVHEGRGATDTVPIATSRGRARLEEISIVDVEKYGIGST